MHPGPRFVAAALLGALAALGLVALAYGSEHGTAARVTLQVAPRGLGTVTVTPPGLDADNQVVSTCKAAEGGESCILTFDKGQSVTLTATGTAGRSLSAWSDPDCPATAACRIVLDDDATSVVAVFSPLRLGVRLSNPDAGHVTTQPVGRPCTQVPDDGGDQCFEFAPGSSVTATIATSAGHTFRGWSPGCEQTTSTTCTITVRDEPTWIGATFDDDDVPQLPTTITVQFQLKRTGNGRGRVTGTKLDCGSVCTAQYDYGKALTLTVAGESGSVFDGWNGVCSKAQTSCTFPVGPITSIRATFVRDATPPTVPTGLSVTSATRKGIAVRWDASSDNVGVAGYRVYLDDAPARDTTETANVFEGLACGRTYAVGVDAVDAVGNRSAKATIDAPTKACKLAARIAAVNVTRSGHDRTLRVTLRVNLATSARLSLHASNRRVAAGRYPVVSGTNTLRLRLPRAWAGGRCRLSTVLVDPDGGSLVLPGRNLLIPSRR